MEHEKAPSGAFFYSQFLLAGINNKKNTFGEKQDGNLTKMEVGSS